MSGVPAAHTLLHGLVCVCTSAGKAHIISQYPTSIITEKTGPAELTKAKFLQLLSARHAIQPLEVIIQDGKDEIHFFSAPQTVEKSEFPSTINIIDDIKLNNQQYIDQNNQSIPDFEKWFKSSPKLSPVKTKTKIKIRKQNDKKVSEYKHGVEKQQTNNTHSTSNDENIIELPRVFSLMQQVPGVKITESKVAVCTVVIIVKVPQPWWLRPNNFMEVSKELGSTLVKQELLQRYLHMLLYPRKHWKAKQVQATFDGALETTFLELQAHGFSAFRLNAISTANLRVTPNCTKINVNIQSLFSMQVANGSVESPDLKSLLDTATLFTPLSRLRDSLGLQQAPFKNLLITAISLPGIILGRVISPLDVFKTNHAAMGNDNACDHILRRFGASSLDQLITNFSGGLQIADACAQLGRQLDKSAVHKLISTAVVTELLLKVD